MGEFYFWVSDASILGCLVGLALKVDDLDAPSRVLSVLFVLLTFHVRTRFRPFSPICVPKSDYSAGLGILSAVGVENPTLNRKCVLVMALSVYRSSDIKVIAPLEVV